MIVALGNLLDNPKETTLPFFRDEKGAGEWLRRVTGAGWSAQACLGP